MKAIVHIGFPKTGTSSIQALLFSNGEALAKQGFRFHRNVASRGSQYEYALAALSRIGALVPAKEARLRYGVRTIEEQRSKSEPIAAELRNFPRRWSEATAIFSSEHILAWLRRPEWIASLDAMFRESFEDVRYIMYLRPTADMIVSQYSERVKRGGTLTLDEHVGKRIKGASRFQLTHRWAETVGRERLDIRRLDPAFMVNGDLIDDFCTACGIDPAPLERPPRLNESLSASGAECLRALNTRIPEILPEGGLNPARRGLLKKVMQKSAGGPPLALLPRQLELIETALGPSEEALRCTFFPDSEQLFLKKHKVTTPQSVSAAREEALDILAELLAESRTSTSASGPRRSLLRRLVKKIPGAERTAAAYREHLN